MTKLKTKELVLCGLFIALITAGTFIQVPVPGMDYFTLQFFFVLMAGIILGKTLGSISALAYMIIGLLGLPIFAAGGGIMYVVRPSFGYIIGFVAAAFITGLVSEKIKMTGFFKYLLACIAGLIICYAIGLIYKYLMLNLYVGETTAFILVLADCFPLDLPGDIALSLLAAGLSVRLKPLANKILND